MLAEIIPDRLDVTLNQQLTLKALLIRLSFVTILVADNDVCQHRKASPTSANDKEEGGGEGEGG